MMATKEVLDLIGKKEIIMEKLAILNNLQIIIN